MSRTEMLQRLRRSMQTMLADPRGGAHDLSGMSARLRAGNLARGWPEAEATEATEPSDPLRSYFNNVAEGPGIWKWLHYFELYHRHLARYIGTDATLVEVGVYSGGSLGMWQEYLGPRAQIHGVDIQPDCMVYESDQVTIHIGDQGDREFWRGFRSRVAPVDIFIDDGGHTPEQQMVTLEEMLQHVKPGGTYVCEDVHGVNNEFTAFATALVDRLNAFMPEFDQRVLSSPATPFQSGVHSIHFYPYVAVIERREAPLGVLSAPKHGTMWQPFETSVR